jgi:uncharacterized protein YqeY
MSLRQRIEDDLLTATKSKDEVKRDVLRGLKSALKNYEIDVRAELTDADVEKVIAKEAKNRKESIEAYTQANKPELAASEQDELKILQGYLPEQLSEAEIEPIIDQVIAEMGAADKGKVMGRLSQQLKGRADMGVVARIVNQKLG